MPEDRRQTDHATEKCVAMGGSVALQEVIPPNNVGLKSVSLRMTANAQQLNIAAQCRPTVYTVSQKISTTSDRL